MSIFLFGMAAGYLLCLAVEAIIQARAALTAAK
jgi:hypothetical protein